MLEIYTVEEIAKLLKVEANYVRRLIKGEQLGAFKVGNNYRITESALEKYIEANQTGARK